MYYLGGVSSAEGTLHFCVGHNKGDAPAVGGKQRWLQSGATEPELPASDFRVDSLGPVSLRAQLWLQGLEEPLLI